jgi:putative redox protein
MIMTAAAHRVGRTLKHRVEVNGRHTIVTDEPLRLGGTNEGPAPHELLPAALASCIATMIAMYAERRGWEIGEASVEVGYDPKAQPRAFRIDVRLPASLTEEQVQRLERVAETCPLRRSLEAGFTFEERIVCSPSSSAASPACI